MTLTFSAVAILAVAAFLVIRAKAGGCGPALVLFLFGFFAAGTGAYGPIHSLCAAFATAITHLRA